MNFSLYRGAWFIVSICSRVFKLLLFKSSFTTGDFSKSFSIFFHVTARVYFS